MNNNNNNNNENIIKQIKNEISFLNETTHKLQLRVVELNELIDRLDTRPQHDKEREHYIQAD